MIFYNAEAYNFLFQVVLSCVEGSPAARAGIHVGDELVEINGMILIWDLIVYPFTFKTISYYTNY